MAEYNLSAASTTNLRTAVQDYSVDQQSLDGNYEQQETYYDYPQSPLRLGYYKTIPELKKAIDALATWTVGKGFETDNLTQSTLTFIRGWGEDTFQSICWNLVVQKKIFGDAFAEIIRDDGGQLLNIKPLYAGDMRVVVGKDGTIIRYEQRTNTKSSKPKVFQPYDILHLVNDRIGNEIHGVSVIDACKWVIDARNEAMTDHRKILHRQLAMGVLYLDTDNTTKRDSLMSTYESAVKNGEVLVLPKDTAELKDPNISLENPLEWIRYLENFFYQAVGVPPAIANPQGFTEASSKVGYMTFEPVYTREQTELESDLKAQVGIIVKFNRPPELTGLLQASEKKNTGQVGFQPSEINASVGRQ